MNDLHSSSILGPQPQPRHHHRKTLSESFRNDRIAQGRQLINQRLLSLEPQRRRQRDDNDGGLWLSSSSSSTTTACPSSLVYSQHADLRNWYYHCTFLDQDDLVLCSHAEGIDLIALPSQHLRRLPRRPCPTRNQRESNDNDGGDGKIQKQASTTLYHGSCVGVLRRNQNRSNNNNNNNGSSENNNKTTRYPYQNTTALFGGKAFVTGSPSGGCYDIYDTETQVSHSPASVGSFQHLSSGGDGDPSRSFRCQPRPISLLASIAGPTRRVQPNLFSNSWNASVAAAAITNRPCHPSWDFLERRGSPSVLAMHIGANRDYVCFHDSRCRQSSAGTAGSPPQMLCIHNLDTQFHLACFVNEQALATTSIPRYSDPTKEYPPPGHLTINLWDIRHSRRPLPDLLLAPHSFAVEESQLLQNIGDRPLSETPFPKMLAESKSIVHLKALGDSGRLHVVTTAPCSQHERREYISLEYQPPGYYLHWIVDLATGDAHRMTVQPMAPSCYVETGSLHSSPFAMANNSHGNASGVLAQASFVQDPNTFDHRVDLSFCSTDPIVPTSFINPLHRSTVGKRKYTDDDSLGSKAPTKSGANKNNNSTPATTYRAVVKKKESRRFLERKGTAIGHLSPRILDDYGLATPLTHLAWNETGTRLVGISSNSDLHIWGAY